MRIFDIEFEEVSNTIPLMRKPHSVRSLPTDGKETLAY